MRIWTLHPKYLDAIGLVALWRETLLAQKVLAGGTRGYRSHPQLLRFKNSADPLAAVAAYLKAVHAEAIARGYHFDAGKIPARPEPEPLDETEGQLAYEWQHLLRKLQQRDPLRFAQNARITTPAPHPLFKLTPGGVREWEIRSKETIP